MDKISNLLTRGVENVLPSRERLSALLKTRKITLYQGFDPSSPSLHIGHLIGIRKLAQFQELGHKVIFLIGDFTGMIGDPTDKSAARKKLTKEKVLENLKGYKDQAGKILKFDGPNAAEVRFNSEWLAKLTFSEIVDLSSHFTVQQLIERDFFQERLIGKKPIYLHEFLYPLMQGYDSVVLDVDLEIGGNDQLFNMLAGRTLMADLKGKDKFVLTMKLLTDPEGRKMGKSEGNAISLTDTPNDMFAKIMAFPDENLELAVELLTDLESSDIKNLQPMDIKKTVAFELVKQLFGEDLAKSTKETFERVVQKRELPEIIPVFKTESAKVSLLEALTKSGSLPSISQAKILIKEGAIEVNGEKVSDTHRELKPSDIVKIGKYKYLKIEN